MSLGEAMREITEIGNDTDAVANGAMTVKLENTTSLTHTLGAASAAIAEVLEQISGMPDAYDGAAVAGQVTKEDLHALGARVQGLGSRSPELETLVERYNWLGDEAPIDEDVEEYKEGIAAVIGSLTLSREVLSRLTSKANIKRSNAASERDYAVRMAEWMREYAKNL